MGDCRAVLQNSTLIEDDEEMTIMFHKEFLEGVLLVVVAYMVTYGIRMFVATKCPDEAGDNIEKQTSRLVARLAFGPTIILLVFAAIGFAPLILTAIACAISITA